MQVSSDRRVPARRMEFASAIVLAALASVATPPPAYAQWAVTCVNCSTTWTQLLQYAKEAQALETQLQQYQTQLQQYTNMITNTVALPQEIWGTVQSDIMQVQALSNAASLLSGNSGSMITRLQSASAYANQVTSLGNTAGQFTTWQQTIGNNLNTMGQTLGLQTVAAAERGRDPASPPAALPIGAGPDAGDPGWKRAGRRQRRAVGADTSNTGLDRADAGNRHGRAGRPAGDRGRRDGAFREPHRVATPVIEQLVRQHANAQDFRCRGRSLRRIPRQPPALAYIVTKARVAGQRHAGTARHRTRPHHSGAKPDLGSAGAPVPPTPEASSGDAAAFVLEAAVGAIVLRRDPIAAPAHAQSANMLDQIVANSRRDLPAGKAHFELRDWDVWHPWPASNWSGPASSSRSVVRT